MPQAIGAAIIWLGETAFTVGPAVVTYGEIAEAIIVAGSIAYSSIESAKMRNQLKNAMKGVDNGQNVMNRDPLANRRKIYGQVPVSGTITFMATTGPTNQDLHICIVLAAHECEELGDILFDAGELVPLDSAGNAVGKYAGYFHCDKHSGWSGQAVDSNLTAVFPDLCPSSFVGKNLAYLHCIFTYNPNLFPNGMPNVRCVVKGKKVFDPRDPSQDRNDPSTYKWSSNPALCVADHLHDPIWGKGIPWSRLSQ